MNYSDFLLRCNDYYRALGKLEEAEEIESENIYIKFEQAKIKGCINEFEAAYQSLKSINVETLSDKNKNIYLTRIVDLKKRESELYDERDLDKKLELIKEAFQSSEQPDNDIYQYMCILLRCLTYVYFDEEVINYMITIPEKYYMEICKVSNFRKYQESMRMKIINIGNEKSKKEIEKYLVNVDEVIKALGPNEGAVYVINYDKRFGFFKTKDYPGGVYFRLYDNLNNLKMGDIVEYDKLYKMY